MSLPLQRVRIGVVVFAVVAVVATIGYRFIGENRDWIDAAYMVVITISSVGFGERSQLTGPEKLFTIAVIVVGMSAAAYSLGGLLQLMTEGEIARTLGLRRATHDIERLRGHVIICGFGRIGQFLAHELKSHQQPLVVVEHVAELVADAQAEGFLVVNGDALEEDVLKSVGVEHAKSLVAALSNDADNVFVTLTARQMAPDLQIIARGDLPSTRNKLLQAGANRVVLPSSIGAQRMAAMITRPSTVELLELVAGRGVVDVRMDELVAPEASALIGQSVHEIAARQRFGLLVVAVKRAQGEMVFSPDESHRFAPGDTLIVMGKLEDIERFRREYGI